MPEAFANLVFDASDKINDTEPTEVVSEASEYDIDTIPDCAEAAGNELPQADLAVA